MRFILRSSIILMLLLASLYSCKSVFTAKAPVELKQVWASDNSLRTPESVLYDPDRDVLYVTNMNQSKDRKDGDGFISKLKPNGEIEELYWVTGLNNPKGMGLHNNVLYVADVDEVITISTQTGAVLEKYKVESAQELNDVTIDNSGNVYISDMAQHRIFQMRNGRITTWIDKTKHERPNGLYWDEDQLVVAFMSNGRVELVVPNTKGFIGFIDGINKADGIAKAGPESYFVSNWDGEVYYVTFESKKWKVLDTKDRNINAADIFYSEKTKLLYVPTFRDNRIVAYSVTF